MILVILLHLDYVYVHHVLWNQSSKRLKQGTLREHKRYLFITFICVMHIKHATNIKMNREKIIVNLLLKLKSNEF
jgi:hypothetical protein